MPKNFYPTPNARTKTETCVQPLKFEKVMQVAGVELGPSQAGGRFPVKAWLGAEKL